jgi:chaperonin GroES
MSAISGRKLTIILIYLPTILNNTFYAVWYRIGVALLSTIFISKTKIHTTMAKKLNITPLHDRVIVQPAAAETKTAGGIIIPDTAKEKPQRGTVLAAGPGKKDEPVTVKAGDTVLYGKYAGTEINVDGSEYLIMRESDILAIV